MPQILDQHGNPIDRAVLAEPQTAKLRALKYEFATHPSRGLTPAKLASILESAEQGDLLAQSDLFADMEEKDGHILAEMGKRKRALLTLPWDIVPPAGASAAEKTLAEEAKEWLVARDDFDDLIFDLMDAAGHAYSCVEIEWERLGREWHPAKFHHRLPSWFQLDRATRTELRLRDNSADGAVLVPFGWIVHVHKAKSGHIARAGLHRALAWPFLFKNYAVRDLAEFLEIYGLPLRVGTYPAGVGDAEKTTLLNAVVGIGHNAAGIIPQGMLIEFKEAAQGTHEPFQAMMDWCERTESKVIVGQVLSAEAKSTGLGSGVATLHSEVRADLKVSDARQLAGTISRAVIYPWVAINRGVTDPRRAPRFMFDTQEPENLKLYADSLPKLTGIGMKIPAAYAHARLKIPQAKDDEEILTAPKQTGSAGEREGGRAEDQDIAAARAQIAAAAAGADESIAAAVADQLAIAEGAGELAGAWREDLGTMVASLVAMAEATGDLVTFRDQLADLLRGDPAPARVRRLERSAFTAQLMGRTAGGPDFADLRAEITDAVREAIRQETARPAQPPVAVHLPESITVTAQLDGGTMAETLKPAAEAMERLAAATAADSSATRGLLARALDRIAVLTASVGENQAREPAWVGRIVAALKDYAERIEKALSRRPPARDRTIELPDGRKFKLTEEDKP